MRQSISNQPLAVALCALFVIGVFFIAGCGEDDLDITHPDDDHVDGDTHDEGEQHVEGDAHDDEHAKQLDINQSKVSGRQLIAPAKAATTRVAKTR